MALGRAHTGFLGIFCCVARLLFIFIFLDFFDQDPAMDACRRDTGAAASGAVCLREGGRVEGRKGGGQDVDSWCECECVFRPSLSMEGCGISPGVTIRPIFCGVGVWITWTTCEPVFSLSHSFILSLSVGLRFFRACACASDWLHAEAVRRVNSRRAQETDHRNHPPLASSLLLMPPRDGGWDECMF